MSATAVPLRVAVVGASSLIGAALLEELRARKLPIAALTALDEQRNVGALLGEDEGRVAISDVAAFDFSQVDLVFFCGRAALAQRYAETAAEHAWVIDASPTFRERADVPLLVADVNPEALAAVGSRGLIALPGSASVALATALAPLRALGSLQRVEVATYQAVSGSGRAAMDELASETVAMLSGKEPRGRAFGQQIAFNVIPQVDELDAHGDSREERRLAAETARVLALPALQVNATAVRVPVFLGHSMVVHAAFGTPVDLLEASRVLQAAAGVRLMSAQSQAPLPTPATLASAPDHVYVGRLRRDPTRDQGLNFWLVADNVRKCAAHNAVSAAQILVNTSR